MRIVLLLFAWIFTSAHCSCPSGFDIARDGECRGLYANINVTYSSAYDNAVSYCNKIQAAPIIIHNDEHHTFWVTQAGKDTSRLHVIGLACNTSSKRWEWADGTALDYMKPVSSNYQDLQNDCKTGCVWYVHSNGYWYLGCGSSYPLFAIHCTTQLTPPARGADGCDSFADDSDNGICYQIGKTLANVQDAQQYCRNFGADLASIHNAKENSFVRRLAVSKSKVDSIILGATPSGKADGFSWLDGSEWNYDYFYPGFPMKGLGDCVAMDTDGTSGQWGNVNCSTKMSFACTRKQNSFDSFACDTGPWKEGDLIYTPGYPFDASTPCDYLLNVPSGKKVQVEIYSLEANSCCDRLMLYENYIGPTIVANLTGEIIDKTYKTSTSNYMRVSWQPQGGVNVRGMMMTFRGV